MKGKCFKFKKICIIIIMILTFVVTSKTIGEELDISQFNIPGEYDTVVDLEDILDPTLLKIIKTTLKTDEKLDSLNILNLSILRLEDGDREVIGEKSLTGISYAKNLKSIYIKNIKDNISAFPDEICQLNNLETIVIESEEPDKSGKFIISSIPENINKLENLKKLRIVNANIGEIPKSLFKIKDLRQLVLPQNKIEEIPIELGEFKKIDFNFQGNLLSVWIKEMGDNSNVKSIDLSNNRLEKIEDGAFNEVLMVLKLNNNNLKTIDKKAFRGKDLTEINLSNNYLEDFPGELISIFSGKKYLDVSNNKIFNLSSIDYNLLKMLDKPQAKIKISGDNQVNQNDKGNWIKNGVYEIRNKLILPKLDEKYFNLDIKIIVKSEKEDLMTLNINNKDFNWKIEDIPDEARVLSYTYTIEILNDFADKIFTVSGESNEKIAGSINDMTYKVIYRSGDKVLREENYQGRLNNEIEIYAKDRIIEDGLAYKLKDFSPKKLLITDDFNNNLLEFNYVLESVEIIDYKDKNKRKRKDTKNNEVKEKSSIENKEINFENLEKVVKTQYRFKDGDGLNYIFGYPDKTFRPEKELSRKELVEILYRIIDIRNISYNETTNFIDTEKDVWFQEALIKLQGANLIKGYGDGSFKPNKGVSRAEFAMIISRILGDYESIGNKDIFYKDLGKDHWAYKSIINLSKREILSGYGDGSFRPDKSIKRSELVKSLNKVLGKDISEKRKKDIEELPSPFTDLDRSHWAYYEIISNFID